MGLAITFLALGGFAYLVRQQYPEQHPAVFVLLILLFPLIIIIAIKESLK